MTTSIRVPQDTLREILTSIDELVKFSEGASVDLNITTKNETILIYVVPPSMGLVHELIPGEKVEVSVSEEGEKICLNPNELNKVVSKAEEGTLEIEFLEHEYVVQYEEDEIFSKPLTLRLRRFVDTEFEDPPDIGELKMLGSLNRVSLSRALNVMSTVSPVVQIAVESGLLSLRVQDKVSGEGEVSPKITNSEIENFDSWYSIDPLIRFLRTNTSGDDVELFVSPNDVLVVEIASAQKNSRLYISPRVESP